MKRQGLLILVCLFTLLKGVEAQTDSVFWFVAPRITPNHPASPPNTGGRPILLRLASLGQTTVTISMPANPPFTFTPISVYFPRDTAITVDLSAFRNIGTPANSIENVPENTVLNKGILIKSDRNLITAYYDIDHTWNRDIFALKGSSALGTEFYVPMQNSWSNGSYTPEQPYSKIDIVATEDSTVVQITPSANMVGHTKAAGTFSVTLNRGQTFSCKAAAQTVAGHLGGTHIVSNKKIAVTVTDDSVATSTARDIQGDQIVPLNIIGKEYIVMRARLNLTGCSGAIPTEGTATGEKAFIIGTQAGTTVTANSVSLGSVGAGGIIAYDIKNNSTYIVADKPVYVYHTAGFGCETGAAILPKIENCTGSKSVTIVRGKSDPLLLNIMTTNAGKNSLFMEYRQSGIDYIKPIPQGNFEQVGTSDFWVLKANKKQFDSIPVDVNVRVYSGPNGDRFHLGIINGNTGNGCKYGYFSDYREDVGSAVINNNSSDAYQGCYNDSIQLTATGGLSYKWSLVGSAVNYLNDSTIANPLAMPPPGIYDYKVTIRRPSCYIPRDIDIIVKVEVAPQLVASFEIDKSITCSPDNTIKFSNNSVGSNLIYYWDYQNDGNPDTTNYNKNPFYHTFPRNTGSTPIVYNTQLLAINSLYTACLSQISKNITIYPEINASYTQDKTISCHPLTVNFTNASTGDTTNAVYVWDFGDGNTTTTRSPSHTYNNLYGPGNIINNISLIATSRYNCRDTATSQATVRPFLDAGFTLDTTRGCANFPVNVHNTSTGTISSYNWDFGDGTPTSALPNPTHTYYNNGNAALTRNLRLIVSNSGGACTSTLTRQVTVLPKVVALYSIFPNNADCNPLSVTFAATSNTPPVTYKWTFGDSTTYLTNSPSTFSHTFNNTLPSGNKIFLNTLTVTSNDYCTQTFSNNITVYDQIKADFTISKVEGCSGFTTIITNKSSGGIFSYGWNFGDGDTSIYSGTTPFTHIYNNPTSSDTTYNLVLTVSNNEGCTSTLSKLITVHPGVAADFSITNPKGCDSLTVTFTNKTDMSKASQVKWEFGDGVSSFATPTVTHKYGHLNSGDTYYTVKLIAASLTGCIDTMTKTDSIEVYSYIKAGFAVDDAIGCSPLDVQITDNSEGGITLRTWRYGDGVSDNHTNVIYNHIYTNKINNPAPLQRILKLIVQNSHLCKDSLLDTITVYPEPFASFTANSFVGCTPLPVQFTNQSNTVATSYYWDFDDGKSSILTNPKDTFANLSGADTTYHVKLTATSAYSCTDDTIRDITVYAYNEAGFTINQSLICSDAPVSFTNTSPPGATHSYWDFTGDGINDKNDYNIDNFTQRLYNTDTVPDSINVRLVTMNSHFSCPDTAYQLVTVNPRVLSDFTVTPDNGCQPLTASFTNLANIRDLPTTTFHWDFGDGSSTSDKNPVPHTYTNSTKDDTIYPVTLTTTSLYMCSHDTTKYVNAYAYIDANFNIPVALSCSDYPFTVNNNSPNGVTQSFWDFYGTDTDTMINTRPGFTYKYLNTDTILRTYNLRLVVKNNHACYDTMVKPVQIYPRIISSFTTDVTSGCQPLNVFFTNTSSILNTPGAVFNWDFGDGSSSALKDSVSHEYFNFTSNDTTFTATLTATSSYGCSKDTSAVITPYAFIDADFKLDKAATCSDLNVTITNNSPDGVKQSSWNFGEVITDTIINNTIFTHEYYNTTLLPVYRKLRLIVSNLHPCYDTLTDSVLVYPRVISAFSADKDSGCQPASITFTNNSNHFGLPYTNYNWSFGDGGTSVDKNKTVPHLFYNISDTDRIYPVKLETVSEYLCRHDTTMNVKVFGRVKADFVLAKAGICSGETLKIYNNSSAGVTHCKWVLYNTTEQEINTPVITTNPYTNTSLINDTFNIRLVASNDHACSDTMKQDLLVYPRVWSRFGINPFSGKGCQPFTVKFTNYTTVRNLPNTSTYWYFGDGSTSDAKDSVSHTFYNSSPVNDTFRVRLRTVSQNLCEDDTVVNIIAYPYIKADFTIANAAICSDHDVTIYDNSPPGVTYTSWDYGDGYSVTNPSVNPFTHPYSNIDTFPVYYKIRQIVRNSFASCRDTLIDSVLVYPRVVTDFEADQYEGCQPLTVGFTNTTNLVNLPKTKYTWDFGDGNTSSDINPTHTFENLLSADYPYYVTLNVTSEYLCTGNTAQYPITPYAYIDADFKVENSEICSGNAAIITEVSPNGVKYRYWYWDYNSSITPDPNSNYIKGQFKHTYTNTGTVPDTKKLRLIVTNNHTSCRDTLTRDIVVNPQVTADFNGTAMAGCSPLTTTFINISKNANTYNWDFGDDNTSSLKSPKKTYINYTTNDEIRNVRLIAVSNYNCSDTLTDTVTIYHKPQAKFFVNKTADCPPFNVIFNNTSLSSNASYVWDYGDGSPLDSIEDATAVAHTFLNFDTTVNIRTYNITLYSETNKGCRDTSVLPISVYPAVKALFDTVERGCSPIDAMFINKSWPTAKDFSWDFGDGNTSVQKNPSNIFRNFSGENITYNVWLKVVSEYGCKDSTSYGLVVYPKPEANFTVLPTLQYYPHDTFTIKNTTSPGPWIYDWNFADSLEHLNTSDTSFNYTYGHWGKYNIKLIASYGACADTTNQNIELKAPIPVASFGSSDSGCTPVTVFFNNNSMYASAYLWEFDDDTKSTLKNPSHTFTDPREYNVKLTVFGDGGSDHHYEYIKVYPKPTVSFYIDPATIKLGDVIKCSNNTKDATIFYWDFGDNTGKSTESDPLYKYANIGDYTIKLVAYSDTIYKCSDSAENVIKVEAKSHIMFPNAFTPNMSGPLGGEYNEDYLNSHLIFLPRTNYDYVTEYHLEIYNRWGELIFVSKDVRIGWDGYYKGKLCAQDVYVYKARGKYINGRTFLIAGDITLIYRQKNMKK